MEINKAKIKFLYVELKGINAKVRNYDNLELINVYKVMVNSYQKRINASLTECHEMKQKLKERVIEIKAAVAKLYDHKIPLPPDFATEFPLSSRPYMRTKIKQSFCLQW